MDSETMGRLSMGGGGGGGVGKRTVVDGKEGGGIADGGVDGVVDGRERGYVPPVVEGRSCCSRDWTMQQGHCSEAAGMCGKDPVRAGTYSAACEARGPLYLGVAGAPSSSQEAKKPRSQASKHPARAPPGVASGP